MSLLYQKHASRPLTLDNRVEPELYRDVFPYTHVSRIEFDDTFLVPRPADPMFITDTTFRDGQQARPPYTVKQIARIYDLLHKLGGKSGLIQASEFFMYSPKDRKAIEVCRSRGYRFPRVTGWIRANMDDLKIAHDMEFDEVGLLTSMSDYHIFLKLGKTREQAMNDYLKVVTKALEWGIVPRCHFEDVTRADIYGFSLPRLFGVHTQPTNLNGMLMPVTAWGVKMISIGMFAGADRAILWRGPRLQRSLEQFLSDVWWGEPDVLLLDLAPGTGDMAISVAQALPNAELVVVTTPQPSASDIAVRSGLVALQVPMKVRGVVENMSYFEHRGERLKIFGEGGGERVSLQLSQNLGYEVPLLAQLPLEPELRETGEAGRPAVLTEEGALRTDGLGATFRQLAESLMRVPLR